MKESRRAKYILCVVVTMVLIFVAVCLLFHHQASKYYGIEQVTLFRATYSEGTTQKVVTDPGDIAQMVKALREMELRDITRADALYGATGYGFKLQMTDGTSYSGSYAHGDGGIGPYIDSEGREMTVRLNLGELWDEMDYTETPWEGDPSVGWF